MMLHHIKKFYKTSPASDIPFQGTEREQDKFYKKLRLQAFLAGTVGYSLYYVCRTSLNVVKKPILDSGILDAGQLGIISSQRPQDDKILKRQEKPTKGIKSVNQ